MFNSRSYTSPVQRYVDYNLFVMKPNGKFGPRAVPEIRVETFRKWQAEGREMAITWKYFNQTGTISGKITGIHVAHPDFFYVSFNGQIHGYSTNPDASGYITSIKLRPVKKPQP